MAPLSASRLRAINLIELLKEEGGEGEEQEVPEEAVDWPEGKIRAWFSERKRESGVKADGGDVAPLRPLPPPPDLDRLRSLWFPSASRLAPSSSLPSCVLVAFACAGSAEDLFSSEGSGTRRAPSPLLRWLKDNGGQLLSVQLPGRAARRKEAFARSAAEVARVVVSLVAAEVTRCAEADDGREKKIVVPWFVAGHSMGAWLGFELASAARELGVHPPKRLMLSAMPPPHTPPDERPWRGPAAALPTGELVEECRAWGISEAVFGPGVWEDYEPLLRADFRLFDEYEFVRGADPPFPSKLTFFFGDRDARVPERVAGEWERYAEGGGESGEEESQTRDDAADAADGAAVRVVRRRANFELVRVVEGRHLWPLDKQQKQAWLFEIARRMASDLGLPPPPAE